MGRWAVVVMLSTLAFTGGCAKPKPEPSRSLVLTRHIDANPDDLRRYPVRASEYTIGPFDRLRLAVWRYEDLSGEILVK